VEVLDQLSQLEKQVFFDSLPIINKNMDFFVIRFYNYFLRSNAGHLFKNTQIENQYKMFNTALNVIISHISDSTLLEDYLALLVDEHAHYGVISDHIDNFVESFINALSEIFNNDSEKSIILIWYKVISEIMHYFKENLSNNMN
jgi:hemoglobin-like flavoprotein